jgi:peptidoglycan hydrolase-like protein with peptidoglycan-binding domain
MARGLELANVRGIENVSQAFKDKVIRIAVDLDMNPNFLMAVMSFESGGTFSPSVRNAAGSGAVGLIQVMPATARALGTTTAELAAMTAEDQLDFVAKYFAPHRGRLRSIEDTYMAVLWPKAIGKGLDFVLWARGTVQYRQNSGLDIDRDGRITVLDASDKVRRILSDAGAQTSAGLALAVGAEGSEVNVLQDELIEYGYMTEEEKNTGAGKFGQKTLRALREFQADNHLPVTGTYDADTQEAVRELNEGVKRGSRSNVVLGMQDRLVTLGNITHAEVLTGPKIFGEKTERALMLFQQQHGITPSGVLTSETYRALMMAARAAGPGTGSGGTVIDALLPDGGRGYRTYGRDGNDQFGLSSTIRNLQSLGEAWADRHPDINIFIGDISKRNGGPFSPHSSHKDGRDVDLRPFRHNGVPGPVEVGNPAYDHVLTRELVLLIREMFPGVKILFNDPVLINANLTRFFAGHHNHLHVRFA